MALSVQEQRTLQAMERRCRADDAVFTARFERCLATLGCRRFRHLRCCWIAASVGAAGHNRHGELGLLLTLVLLAAVGPPAAAGPLLVAAATVAGLAVSRLGWRAGRAARRRRLTGRPGGRLG